MARFFPQVKPCFNWTGKSRKNFPVTRGLDAVGYVTTATSAQHLMAPHAQFGGGGRGRGVGGGGVLMAPDATHLVAPHMQVGAGGRGRGGGGRTQVAVPTGERADKVCVCVCVCVCADLWPKNGICSPCFRIHPCIMQFPFPYVEHQK